MDKFNLLSWVPSVLVVLSGFVLIYLSHKYVQKRNQLDQENSWMRQLAWFALCIFFFIAVVVSFPIDPATRKSVFNLVGIAVTAVIALSSTSFVGNLMSALMLKVVGSIRPGDFLTVEGHQGRVSEQGLLHTEIQTEERTLTTIPNLYLITHPHTVVRSTGTVISTQLSLGYDVSRFKIEKALKRAAEKAELKDAYVQVVSLGDFSVTYRVAGFLEKVKFLITSRAKLMAAVLDCLHEEGIEIVSPTFMNQRVWDTTKEFIPKVSFQEKKEAEKQKTPVVEEMIFDKAEEAETKEAVKSIINKVEDRISEIKQKLKFEEEEEKKKQLQMRLEIMEKRKEGLLQKMEEFTED